MLHRCLSLTEHSSPRKEFQDLLPATRLLLLISFAFLRGHTCLQSEFCWRVLQYSPLFYSSIWTRWKMTSRLWRHTLPWYPWLCGNKWRLLCKICKNKWKKNYKLAKSSREAPDSSGRGFLCQDFSENMPQTLRCLFFVSYNFHLTLLLQRSCHATMAQGTVVMRPLMI